MQDYSQHGEQAIILDYFGGYKGTLLDIGANDGVTFSNSRALAWKGWQGVLVEPSKETFRQLEKNAISPNMFQYFNWAVGNKNGVSEFFESGSLINGHDHSLVSSLISEETYRWRKRSKPEDPIVKFDVTQVMEKTFAETMRFSMWRVFDFITIDVEGMELDILKQMDLKALGCKMLCVEYNGKNEEVFTEVVGMPLYWKNRTNLIYAI